MKNKLFRMIPKIDEILNDARVIKYLEEYPRVYLINASNEKLNSIRNQIRSLDDSNILKFKVDFDEIVNEVVKNATLKSQTKLRRVINATGVVIHTNMGRSLLSEKALSNALKLASNYNNLELNLETGKRGSRYDHLEELITMITGAEACHIVNNNAAAVMLVLASMASGKEVIVSRSELVEIGGSFRVPDIMKLSSCNLVEVGCTNKTHLLDYQNAISEETAMILKVHTSNYKIMGFTESQSVGDLAILAKAENIPLVEDIGSGSLIDLSKFGIAGEPTVMDSLQAGADVVTFSGDKLLGGPQCGIIVGKKEYIDKMKKHQLTRAFRVDKVILSLLETTLREYLDEEKLLKNNPTLSMITADKVALLNKTKAFKNVLDEINGLNTEIVEAVSEVGGGSLPLTELYGFNLVVSVDGISNEKLKTALREYRIPIIARINDDKLLFDVRTLKVEEFDIIKTALKEIIA